MYDVDSIKPLERGQEVADARNGSLVAHEEENNSMNNPARGSMANAKGSLVRQTLLLTASL